MIARNVQLKLAYTTDDGLQSEEVHVPGASTLSVQKVAHYSSEDGTVTSYVTVSLKFTATVAKKE